MNDDRSPVVRPAPRSASTGSVRVANHAGAAPKTIPVMSASRNARPRTNGEGTALMGRNDELPNASASSRRAAAIDTARPATPPATASSTLSTSACETICRRVAPTAMRRAVCVRRATARASSRLATLAHAMRSTSPQTASRIWRLRPYASFIAATPEPAGTTLITCCGSMRMTSGIQLAGYPESFRIQLRSSSVKRGDIPSTDAPGRRRPMTRSQADTDCRSECAAAVDERFLRQGNPQVGRIAAKRFAEETCRCHTHDRERVARQHEGRANDRRITAVTHSARYGD